VARSQARWIRELMGKQCEKRNIDFKFGKFHPVAGGNVRGTLNVLVGRGKISFSYDKLTKWNLINDEFPNTDLVFVVGRK